MNKVILIFALLISISIQQQCAEGQKLVEIWSAGTDDGNYILIQLDGSDLMNYEQQTGENMGMHVIVIEKTTLAEKARKSFKLATNGLGLESENTELKTFIDSQAVEGDYILVGVKGGAQLTNQVGIDALKTLGADNWPELNVARINFALIGQKGKDAGTAVFNHKFRWYGPVSVSACLLPVTSTEALKPVCQVGQYFEESQCKECAANCELCDQGTICQQCKEGYIQLQANECVENTLYECPKDYAMLNFKCIEYACLEELGKLSAEYLDGECWHTGDAGSQIYHVKVSSDQFKMNKSCFYSQVVYRQEKGDGELLNVEEIEKAVVIGDKESSISFEYSLANVLDKCEVDELETTNIKYDCYFVITIAVAGIEQSDINYKFSVIIDRNTQAGISTEIKKNTINLCQNDDCVHRVSVPSKLQNCNANFECSDELQTKYKRGDHIYIKHQIDDEVLNQYYLVPVVVQLISTSTDIKIKDYVYKNSDAGYITFDITFPLAVGKTTLNVQSKLQIEAPTLLMLRRRVLQPQTPTKQQVIETNLAVEIDETETTDNTVDDKEPEEKKKLSGGAIAGIVIGVIVGVALLGAGGFFGYKYMKNKKQDQPHQAAKEEQYKEQNVQE